MPRRKISIEEAFDVLQQAGINVQVKPPEIPVGEAQSQPAPAKKKGQIFPTGTVVHGTPHNFVKVSLFAKHTIGSGGVITAGADGKQVEHAGVLQYGPGVCNVPVEHAAYLLSQDQKARAVDERTYDGKLRSYIVVKRYNSDGQGVSVGAPVDNELFDDFASLPGYSFRIQ